MSDISIPLSDSERLTIKTLGEIGIKHGLNDGGQWPTMRLAFQVLPLIQKIELAEVEAAKPPTPTTKTE